MADLLIPGVGVVQEDTSDLLIPGCGVVEAQGAAGGPDTYSAAGDLSSSGAPTRRIAVHRTQAGEL